MSLGDTGLTVPLSQGGDTSTIAGCATIARPASIHERARAARLDSDMPVIDWANEHNVTKLPLARLEACTGGRAKAWYGDRYPDVSRYSHAQLPSDRAAVRHWLEAMIVEGISVVNVIGKVRPTFFGTHFGAGIHINPSNTACTAGTLVLHTDTAAGNFPQMGPEGPRLPGETDVPFHCAHGDCDMRAYQNKAAQWPGLSRNTPGYRPPSGCCPQPFRGPVLRKRLTEMRLVADKPEDDTGILHPGLCARGFIGDGAARLGPTFHHPPVRPGYVKAACFGIPTQMRHHHQVGAGHRPAAIVDQDPVGMEADGLGQMQTGHIFRRPVAASGT